MNKLLPGDSVGIVGGGQLGRMAAMAAVRLGLRVLVLDPDLDCPAAACATILPAEYDDVNAIRELSWRSKLITIEFENLSAEALRTAECPVLPSPDVLTICQARDLEKTFLSTHHFPVPTFHFLHPTSSPEEIVSAVSEIGFPGIVKTLRMGYDGKGQRKVANLSELKLALSEMSVGIIYESFVPFIREVSVIVARNESGACQCFPVVENIHKNHILDITIAPAPDAGRIEKQAYDIATGIADKIGLVGLLCVEMFETESHELLINELAPRPHNSGHWTIEGATTSQYEQLWRAVGGLPLADPKMIAHEAAMVNMLGDLWINGEPNWEKILKEPGVNLHLYGKREARPGRKMGHLTVVGENAAQRALAVRERLTKH